MRDRSPIQWSLVFPLLADAVAVSIFALAADPVTQRCGLGAAMVALAVLVVACMRLVLLGQSDLRMQQMSVIAQMTIENGHGLRVAEAVQDVSVPPEYDIDDEWRRLSEDSA